VTVPPIDLAKRYPAAKPTDGSSQLVFQVDGELAKRPFEVCPQQLDGVELRAVGGQVDRRRSGTLDSPFDGLHLVDVEVVHDDDIAWPEPRDEPGADEAQEDGTSHCASVSHELRLRPSADGADERDGLPGPKRSSPDGPLSSWRPGEFASHAGLAERFVDENEPTFGHGSDEGAKGPAALGVLGGVSLYRDEGLFFRE